MSASVDPLTQIRIEPGQAGGESLVHCLLAILAAWNRPVDYTELACALGTAVMTTCAKQAAPNQRWNVYGRHAFAVEAARQYGLELRELHPPRAAPFPPAPPEFHDHWRDSYMPFVRESIARGEPVLAWMGWSPPCEADWGVITGIDSAGQAVGFAHASDNRIGGQDLATSRQALVGSPVQAYCVTVIEPAPGGADNHRDDANSRARCIVERFRAVLGNQLPPEYGVISGAAALEALRDAASHEMQIEVLKRLREDRVAACDYLRELSRKCNRETTSLLERFAGELDGQLGIVASLLGNQSRGLFEELAAADLRLITRC